MVLLFVRNQLTLVYMLIKTTMYHGCLEHHRLGALLHMQKIFIHQKKSELENIKSYASWNNFLKHVTNNIMKKVIKLSKPSN